MLADYEQLTDSLVRDDTGKITVADRDDAIALAVLRYGQDRPQIKVEDITAPGGKLLDLPPAWQTDFSALNSVEYPIGEVPPTTVDWQFYETPTVIKIMLASAITLGQSVRMNFTIRHVLDGANDTIRADDREAVCAWAASVLLDQLAALFSGDSDSTIQADSVDHQSKSAEYARRARRMRESYWNKMGVDPKRSVAAAAVVDLDQSDSRGRDRLLHNKRYR